jgi:peptidase S9
MIALEDFFRNAKSSSYRLSPDGHYLAYLAPYSDRMNLFVRSIAADGQLGEPIRLTSETDRSLGGYLWADNERLIYAKDEGGDENYHLFGIRRDGSDERDYTNFPGVRAGIIDDLPEVPGQILIEMNRRNPEAFDPYRLDLDTGELTLLAENPGNYQGWTTDHEGRLRVVYAIVDGVNTQILYRDHEGEDFRPVLTTNFRENVCYSLFTPDNKMVWGVSNRGRDKNALVLIDPATAEEREVLFEHERYDVDALTYSRKRQCLLGAFCAGHREPVRHYFEETARKQRTRLEKHFPGRQIGLVDTDRDEVRYIVLVAGDRTRGAYYFYDRESDHMELLAEVAPWLPESEMVPMHPVTFTTRDGLLIEAYLSLPPGVELNAIDTPLPVIVNPHGGPWTRDDWGFSSEVQFLCSRGYAVFQLNFRGSTGYGREFLEKSYKQWGLSMQDDITDGVHWLIDSGIADPKRIAIYGASYGGYATLAGACFTPDLYCCAIDYVGVSNLLTFLQTIPPYWRSMLEMMYEQVGHPERDRAQLEATSPALHADAIRCPLFIAQGANDPRVNKDESDQMVAALRSRGVEVEYMVKDNEGHGFANQENRFDFYRAVERFLQTHV